MLLIVAEIDIPRLFLGALNGELSELKHFFYFGVLHHQF